MKYFNKALIAMMVFCLAFSAIPAMNAYASSASIEFTSDTEIVKVGDTVNVVFSVTSQDSAIGNVETFIAYDPMVLQFVSGGKFIKGDNGILKVNDVDNGDGGQKKTYTLKFLALNKGVTTIEISGGNADVTDFADNTSMSVSFGSISLAVGASATASDDCTLKSLKLSPGELDKEFDPEVTEYKMTLPFENDFIVMSAVANDPNATVKIFGTDELTVGWNHPVITVTSESGKIKEYNFSIYRQSENESNTDTTTGNVLEELVSANNFKVLDDNGNKILQSQYAYQLVDLEDSSKIPTGYVKNSLKIYDNVKITVYTLENNQNSDYFLVYAADASGVAQFYEFDKVEKTIQRYNGSLRETVSKTDAVEMTSDEYSQNLTIFAIIIAVLASLLAIMFVFTIKLFIKARGLNSDDLD